MADSQTYQKDSVLPNLFAQARAQNQKAIADLAEILELAGEKAPQWTSDLQEQWRTGIEPAFKQFVPGQTIPQTYARLLRALLDCGLDSVALRDHYVLLFKNLFPNCQNPAGIADILGFRKPDLPVLDAAKRLALYEDLHIGDSCYDLGLCIGGVVTAIDELNCEVQIQADRPRTIPLDQFLDTYIRIQSGSSLAKILQHQKVAPFQSREAFEGEARASIKALNPVSNEDIYKMLVPGIMTAAEFDVLTGAPPPPPQPVKAAPAPTPKETELSQRWDHSRSLAELEIRINKANEGAGIADTENPNFDNLTNLLTRDAGRPDVAPRWAAVVASIQRCAKFQEWLAECIRKITPAPVVWRDIKIFLTITDKMTGKLVFPWMQITGVIMGDDYLVTHTLQLPYRLWTHTEKVLEDAGKPGDFSTQVFKAFNSNTPTPDHYFWLWKARPPKDRAAKAAFEAERTRHLSNAFLLFRTLHQELRGNYLKSQRQMMKLLLEDKSFQRTLIADGAPEEERAKAVQNLLNCIKHLPLLSASDKQSLLVKIAALAPSAKPIIEELFTPPATQKYPRVTSGRSYQRKKEELDHLVNVERPANVRAIAEARSHGDLSENAEYKYAKEQERNLNKKQAELQRELANVKPTDFRKITITGSIVPGCAITLQNLATSQEERIFLLGIFDTNPDRKFFSFESPIGELLLGHAVGDRVKMPAGYEASIVAIDTLPEEILQELDPVEEEE